MKQVRKRQRIILSTAFIVGMVLPISTLHFNAKEVNQNNAVTKFHIDTDTAKINANRAAGKFDLPDDALEQYIMDAAGYTGALGTMDESELSSLNNAYEFDIPKGVTTLEGLDYYIAKGYFPNVETLTIASPVQRLDALEGLSITTIWIIDTEGGIAQFPDMSNWTQLSKIKITDNPNTTPIDLNLLNIETMQSLKNLEIDTSPNVINLDALGKSPSLTDLTIEGVPVDTSAINSIGNISTLENLTIIDAGLTDISGLLNLPNLVALDLSSNQITDISAPSNLPNLMYLYLNDNQISNISTLENLTKLDELDLSNNQISDISVLENLNDLSYLYLSSNKISDFRPLETQYAAGTHIYGDNQSIEINLGEFDDIENIKTLPTEASLYWADGTEIKVPYTFDINDVVNYQDYSYGPFSFDSGLTEYGRPLFFGDITITFSYVAPIPLTPIGPSNPITPLTPLEPATPVDNDSNSIDNTSKIGNKSDVTNDNDTLPELEETGLKITSFILSITAIALTSITLLFTNKKED